jgi:hypothetical protein
MALALLTQGNRSPVLVPSLHGQDEFMLVVYHSSSLEKGSSMLRPVLIFALLVISAPALADERKLSGAEIKQALADHTLKGKGDNGEWTQDFDPSGRTTYSQGNSNSPGTWQIKGDQYCSAWPPNPNLSCYDVTRDGDTVTFISSGGGRAPGVIVK